MKITTSKSGLDLIKKHEGLRLTSYLCPANVWTIGYGHTRTARQGQVITEQQAEDLLRSDLEIAEAVVGRHTSRLELNQNQLDALISFVFNVGSGAFFQSTLLKRLRSMGTEREIRNEFSRWNRGGGKVLQGLVKRRQEEANLFYKEV